MIDVHLPTSSRSPVRWHTVAAVACMMLLAAGCRADGDVAAPADDAPADAPVDGPSDAPDADTDATDRPEADGPADGGDGDEDADAADGAFPPHSTIVHGPLCTQLPGDDDPGGPVTLVDETADVALEWIPVLSILEAAARAIGYDEELRTSDGATLLAPTDDAFEAVFEEQTIDDLILFRHDELQALLDAHLVDGVHDLADLLDVGEVTTRSGERVSVVRHGDATTIDGVAEVVCADYLASNARIHVIDTVRGDLPPQSPDDEYGDG